MGTSSMRFCCVFLAAFLCFVGVCGGATCISDESTGGGNWTDASTWECDGVDTTPQDDDTVIIRNTTVILNDFVQVIDTLTIESAGGLWITDDGDLSVHKGAMITDYSDLIIDEDGSFDVRGFGSGNVFIILSEGSELSHDGTEDLNVEKLTNDGGSAYIQLFDSKMTKTGTGIVSIEGYQGASSLASTAFMHSFSSYLYVESSMKIDGGGSRVIYNDNSLNFLYNGGEAYLFVDDSCLYVDGWLSIYGGGSDRSYAAGDAALKLYSSSLHVGDTLTVRGGTCFGSPSSSSGDGGVCDGYFYQAHLEVGGDVVCTGGRGGDSLSLSAGTSLGGGGYSRMAFLYSLFDFGDYLTITGGKGGSDRQTAGHANLGVCGDGGDAYLSVFSSIVVPGNDVSVIGGAGGDECGRPGYGGEASIDMYAGIGERFSASQLFNDIIIVGGTGGLAVISDTGEYGVISAGGGNAGIRVNCTILQADNLYLYGGATGDLLLSDYYIYTDSFYPITRFQAGEAQFLAYHSAVHIRGVVQIAGGNGGTVVEYYQYAVDHAFATFGGHAAVSFEYTVSNIRSSLVISGGEGGSVTVYGYGGGGGEATLNLYYSSALFGDVTQLRGGNGGVGLDSSCTQAQEWGYGGNTAFYFDHSTAIFSGDVTLQAGAGGSAPTYLPNSVLDYGCVGFGGYSIVSLTGSKAQFGGDLLITAGDGGDSSLPYSYGRDGGEAVLSSYYSVISQIGTGVLSIASGSGGSGGYLLYAKGGNGGRVYVNSQDSYLSITSSGGVFLTGGNGGPTDGYVFKYFGPSGFGGPIKALFNDSFVYIAGDFLSVAGTSGDTVDTASDPPTSAIYLDGYAWIGGNVLLQGATGATAHQDSKKDSYFTTAGTGGSAHFTTGRLYATIGGYLAIKGGDGGDLTGVSELYYYQSTRDGGEAVFFMGAHYVLNVHEAISVSTTFIVNGDLIVSGGDGGDVSDTLATRTGDGGNAKIAISTYGTQHLYVWSSMFVEGGDGGSTYLDGPADCYYCAISDDSDFWYAGNGGIASVFSTESAGELCDECILNHAQLITVGEQMYVVGGDSGSSVNCENRGGHAIVYYLQIVVGNSTEYVSLNVAGGDGGAAFGHVYFPQYSAYGGDGGEAQIEFCNINATGSITVLGGDGGAGAYDYAYAGDADTAFIDLSVNTLLANSITIIGGSGGNGKQGGNGGYGRLRAQDASFVSSTADIDIYGGPGGRGYYGSGGSGGFSSLVLSTSNLEAKTDINIVSRGGGDAYIYSAGYTDSASFFAYSSNFLVNRNLRIIEEPSGDCVSIENCYGGYDTNNLDEKSGLYLYLSRGVVGGTFEAVAADIGTSSGDYGGGYAYTVCGILLEQSSRLAVAGHTVVLSGNGGAGAGFGGGGYAYSCKVSAEQSEMLLHTLYIVTPQGGNSGSSSSAGEGGQIYGPSYDYSVVHLDQFSHILVKKNLNITARPSGYSATHPGDIYIDGMITVNANSLLFVENDLIVEGPSSGSLTNTGVGADGGNVNIFISSHSELTVTGDFYAYAGLATGGATGGYFLLAASDASLLEVVGTIYITAGEGGEDVGDGGSSYLLFYGNSEFILRDAEILGGDGGTSNADDGITYIENHCGSKIVVLGELQLNEDDRDVLDQKHGTFVIYPCEDADFVMEGENSHQFSSVFLDCRNDTDSDDLSYSQPTGDGQSDFDCTPCDCGDDVADFESLCPEFLTPS
eukprot:CAMPEP_0174250904 /NCGR_PEP_ID=MMETSP0439-20130205/913_1 /TAXON_ID=0 /ORGANISM="Stereomyxa ramosa, Strain Chinc5" /LENGTH=1711 /DNA_ID=CAMNT_0015331087 /DNA_START=171 /DNA_END=5303 /DNA_ORIENTATION=+